MSTLINPQFHGWRIVAFCGLSQFVAMGFTIYIIGVFIQPMATTFKVSPGVFGWGMGFFYLVNSLAGPVVGSLVDRGYVRPILMTGSALLALSFLAMSQVSNVVQAAVVCILLLAPGMCMVGVLPCSAMLVNWFHRRQAFALGIAALGISLGGFVMPPLAGWLIAKLGWQQTMAVFAGTIALLLIPSSWALAVGRPADLNQYPDGIKDVGGSSKAVASDPELTMKKLIMQKTFWLLTLSVGLLTVCSIVLLTFVVPFAQDKGVSVEASALLVSSYAGAALVGKFLLGWLGDQFSKRKVFILVQVLATLGWLLMVWLDSIVGLVIGATLMGLSIGGLTPLWAALIALYFGPQAFGRVKGLMTLAMLVCTVVPGPLGGVLYDLYGSHATSFALIWWVLPFALLFTVLLPEKRVG
jgi:MFS family permease